MSDLAYFILFESGNFSDAAEEFIFSQIWTSDLLFVRPACKPLIHCVCVWYCSITVMYFDWSSKVSAASKEKKDDYKTVRKVP